ncbi:hypothetical protein Tco_1059784 [Tanacetum coccineum]
METYVWPTIRDGGFNVGNTKVASIRDPRVKLAHRCIATTIAGRKETTHRVIEIDIYYLYCIYTPEVACNIPYWLSKYLKAVKDKNLIYGGMLVTKIARSFRLLTNEFRNALSIEPPPHVFKNKSFIAMGVIMELENGMCAWPVVRAMEEEEDVDDDEGDEAAGGGAGHEEAGGSTAMYRNMSQGDWQVRQARWMDQQDEQWGRPNTWMGQQDERVNWMYDHTTRQFQYMSTCDKLDSHLHIDPFPGREADYPLYGYTGHMPPGYEYRFGPAPGGPELYLKRRSLEVLRKFHWIILGGRFNQFLALGWHLEEIHVTWAHLEKKRTRLRTCTKIHQEVLFSERGDGVAGIKRRRRDLSGDGVWILATASQRSRLKVDLEPSTW